MARLDIGLHAVVLPPPKFSRGKSTDRNLDTYPFGL